MTENCNSRSHRCKRFSSLQTDGDTSKISSAYSMMKTPLVIQPELATPSKQTANKNGAKTEPWRTPKSTCNTADRLSNHLTLENHRGSQHSSRLKIVFRKCCNFLFTIQLMFQLLYEQQPICQ